jgi:hypothetical protein
MQGSQSDTTSTPVSYFALSKPGSPNKYERLMLFCSGTIVSLPSYWVTGDIVIIGFNYYPAPVSVDPEFAVGLWPGWHTVDVNAVVQMIGAQSIRLGGALRLESPRPTPALQMDALRIRATESGPTLGMRVARDVLSLSGLSAQRVGELFPVERETYQRWLSGQIGSPSDSNLERLLSLRTLFDELSGRVTSVKEWLLTSQGGSHGEVTPYSLLRQGRLDAVRSLVVNLPTSTTDSAFVASDSRGAVKIEHAVHVQNSPTTDSELDEMAEWAPDE